MTADFPDMLLACLCYLASAWTAARFLKRQLHGTDTEAGIFGTLLFSGCVLEAVLLQNGNISYMIRILAGYLTVTGLTVAIFRGEKEKKVLAAVVLGVTARLVRNFSESFLCCAALLAIHALTGQETAGMWTDRMIVCGAYGAGIGVINGLSDFLEPVFTDKKRGWYLFLAVLLMFLVLVTDLANWAASNGIMVQNWGTYGLYGNQLLSHGAMCILTGLSMGAAFFFVFGMDRIDREEKAKESYRSQVEYYKMMEEQYGRMERLRHDMKNHMIALAGLVKNREWEQAGRYLEEMAESGSLKSGETVTGSTAVDALLCHKRKQAEEKGIRWHCDAGLFPRPCPVDDMDLCVIIGNILDNAIEGCDRAERQEDEVPFVEVRMETVKKCLLLEVRNRGDIEDMDNLRTTKKEKPWEHGLGIKNIRDTAGRLNGIVHMEAERGVFSVSVLLPLDFGKGQ